MPNLARYLVLAAFTGSLVACIAMLARDTRSRMRRAKSELLARKLDGFSTSLNPSER
jgi:hypothetical protein